MSLRPSQPLVAADIGNTRLKFGVFAEVSEDSLPRPNKTLELPVNDWRPSALSAWLEQAPAESRTWRIASVNYQMAGPVEQWVRTTYPTDDLRVLTFRDLKLKVSLPQPERVGIDRLLGAVAANRIRASDRPVLVVDLGTAIKVNLVSADGTFCGGAILPGIGMSSRALHQGTDLLPPVTIPHGTRQPSALGESTESAIRSGLIWGAVGAIKELIVRLSDDLDSKPQVLVTGGDAPLVADHIGHMAASIEHLVLAGIALTDVPPRR